MLYILLYIFCTTSHISYISACVCMCVVGAGGEREREKEILSNWFTQLGQSKICGAGPQAGSSSKS